MKTEYEVRKLDVDFDVLIKKVENLGAQRKGAFHQKRYVYDFNPAQKGRWIRLRTNGSESTLTIKEIKSLQIDGTKELEIIVSDFENTNELLNKLGFFPRTFQENYRIEYSLDGINFDFDKWPMIPPYLEIEGETQNDVYSALGMLGIKRNEVTTMNIDSLYYKKYNIQLDEIRQLRFTIEELNMMSEFVKEML